MLIDTKVEITINSIFSLVSLFPFLFFIISIISYILSLSIGNILISKKYTYFWSDRYFLFIALVCSSIIGFAFAGINFYIEGLKLKAFFIQLVISLGGMFNASFYIALSKEVNNEKKQNN
ncbi:hypothetical protein GW796_06090 [archaeon]|nr:hypothetical protein [archaeon]